VILPGHYKQDAHNTVKNRGYAGRNNQGRPAPAYYERRDTDKNHEDTNHRVRVHFIPDIIHGKSDKNEKAKNYDAIHQHIPD
jgi:hypothetical protein